jgi:protein-L-isoaspartate(D-aspartate) O-methyltransferase
MTDREVGSGMLKDFLDLIAPQSPRVARAMRRVPRDQFVPAELCEQAGEDRALPIGWGQTISQPSLVALMTRQLDLRPGDKVLEIGTGSGYQAAVLAAMSDVDVYTVEVVLELAAQAAARLQALGFTNVHCKQADGYGGWPEHAPFDAIVITAAAEQVPTPLLDQLAEAGRLVAPIGRPYGMQVLCKYVKSAGTLTESELLLVSFVPLTHDWPEPAAATGNGAGSSQDAVQPQPTDRYRPGVTVP